MNESQRVQRINERINAFASRIFELNYALTGETAEINEQIETGLNQAGERADYVEPANFNKFQRRYQRDFYEQRELAQIEKEDAALEEGIRLQDSLIERQGQVISEIQTLVEENKKAAEDMKSYLTRVQAEIEDIEYQIQAAKDEFTSIGHDASLSPQERTERRNMLRGSLAGATKRLEELNRYADQITGFLNVYGDLSTLENVDTMEVTSMLSNAANVLSTEMNISDFEQKPADVSMDVEDLGDSKRIRFTVGDRKVAPITVSNDKFNEEYISNIINYVVGNVLAEERRHDKVVVNIDNNQYLATELGSFAEEFGKKLNQEALAAEGPVAGTPEEEVAEEKEVEVGTATNTPTGDINNNGNEELGDDITPEVTPEVTPIPEITPVQEEKVENAPAATNDGVLRWAPGYTEEQILDAIERGIDKPEGIEYEQWLNEVVPLGNTNEPGIEYKEPKVANAIRWAAGYTEEQILDCIERGIYEPCGIEYEQWLNEVVPLGNTEEPGIEFVGTLSDPDGYIPRGPQAPSNNNNGPIIPPVGGNGGNTNPPAGGSGSDGGDSGSGNDNDNETPEIEEEQPAQEQVVTGGNTGDNNGEAGNTDGTTTDPEEEKEDKNEKNEPTDEPEVEKATEEEVENVKKDMGDKPKKKKKDTKAYKVVKAVACGAKDLLWNPESRQKSDDVEFAHDFKNGKKFHKWMTGLGLIAACGLSIAAVPAASYVALGVAATGGALWVKDKVVEFKNSDRKTVVGQAKAALGRLKAWAAERKQKRELARNVELDDAQDVSLDDVEEMMIDTNTPAVEAAENVEINEEAINELEGMDVENIEDILADAEENLGKSVTEALDGESVVEGQVDAGDLSFDEMQEMLDLMGAEEDIVEQTPEEITINDIQGWTSEQVQEAIDAGKVDMELANAWLEVNQKFGEVTFEEPSVGASMTM